ncbi:hypothetical protein [Novipirellula rosea]|uniref:Uncharacterized protein n=1 Tax=Novipirellula rosea TaxID=1031540 RepID=A0ABP8NRV8_9BACT
MTIENYDEWLALPDDVRQSCLSKWNAYTHEMFWVPTMAAARLAASSAFPVTDIYVGIYHGGAYVLHLTVDDEHLTSCPKPMKQTFDGFPVIWMGNPYQDPENPRPFLGEWETHGAYGDFRVIVTEGDGLSVQCTDLRAKADLNVFDQRVAFNQLSFVTRTESQNVLHTIRLDDGNVLNYQLTIGQFARKANKEA